MPYKLNHGGEMQQYSKATGEYGSGTKPNVIEKNESLQPSKAIKIENMNESQIDNEIEKTKCDIEYYEKVMDKNKSNRNLDEKGNYFPLGVGGSGWSNQRKKDFNRDVERATTQAKNFTDAYKEKESLEKHLKNLEDAKEKIKGTNKTLSEITKEAKNTAVNEIVNNSTIQWEKSKIKGVYGDINVIKTGDYEIHSADGSHFIYKNGKQVGFTSKLKDAKAYVEKKLTTPNKIQ